MNQLAELIKDIAESHANIARSGVLAGEEHAKRFIRIVLVAYDKALEDPNFRCPTYLHAAIQSARSYSEQTVANNYANATVKRDKELPQWERDSRTGARDEQA